MTLEEWKQSAQLKTPENPGRFTYSVISKVAYLLGVPERFFDNDYDPPQMQIYQELELNKNARIIRNLCLLRNQIEQNYKAIRDEMKFHYKTIMTLPELVSQKAITQLSQDGISIIKSNYQLVQYVVDINRYISDRINNCKSLFPLWLNWDYVRNLFIMPNGLTPEGTKTAAAQYYQNKKFYPYGVYMNWPASDQGNVLYNDSKFVTLLYQWNEDQFTDNSKVSDVGNYTKDNVYEFLMESQRTVFVVDCENSDPYRFSATLRSLPQEETDKISKIILYDDVHAASAWAILSEYTEIPVEHVLIERVKQNKSLVDIRLTAGACKEFYQNQVDSFVLVSSDSDYWGLISSLPEARFLVMVEHEKCGPDIKAALIRSGIFYCYIDDFYSGDSNTLKLTALLREMYQYLDRAFHLNVNEMLDSALLRARVDLPPAEKKQFYDRYIKPMHLEIAPNGDVSISLKAR